jgi:hypothetical protein
VALRNTFIMGLVELRREYTAGARLRKRRSETR